MLFRTLFNEFKSQKLLSLVSLPSQYFKIPEKSDTVPHQEQLSEQGIQQILEAMPVGMMLVDEDRTIRYINRIALDMICVRNAQEMVGQPCTKILCSLEEEQCPLNEGMQPSFSNETYLHSNSDIHPVVLRKAVAVIINGRHMVLETLVDISESKHVEQSLIEKQNYINKIFESAAVGIVVVDISDFTVVEANPAAVAMMGAPTEAIIGSHCRQWGCTHAVDKCPVTSLGQTLENAECELKTAEGRTIPIIKNVSMALLNGRMHIVESFTDITRLKAAEENVTRLNNELEQRVIERTAQLEQANQDLKKALSNLKETQSLLLQSEKMASIGQLAAGVAHEINNPVQYVSSNLRAIDDYRLDLTNLIRAYTTLATRLKQAPPENELLRTDLDTAENLKQEIDLDYILEDFNKAVSESNEGLQRVAKIVGDLKNFAHMESDQTDWVDLNTCIDSTLNIVWNQLKYKVEVIKELGELPEIRCYPQRLNQVIMNLLVNAGQAITEKGRITIKTSAADGQVTISVSDTGEGIQPEHLNKIFDPFFTTKEVGKGTGLGLNVVYNIVKSHSGNIEVESTPGKGTTFRVQLPVEPVFEKNEPMQA